ncbi:MAG: hypothetical protein AB7S81_00540 [Bdellovibrionales bacterium]
MRICRVVRKRNTQEGNVENVLLSALKNLDMKDGQFDFLMTYGGFINTKADRNPNNRSWASTKEDLRPFIEAAEKKINTLITDKFYRVAQGKVRFLSLGVDVSSPDLNSPKLKSSGSHLFKSSAELIAVIDVAKKKIIHWTGKSYPTSDQERTLVQVSDLDSHFIKLGKKEILILGCHDLNMFSSRGASTRKKGGERDKRCKEMCRLLKKHQPQVALHHPHCTDSPRIWQIAWSGLKKILRVEPIWASGIHYAPSKEPKCRGPLKKVLEATRSNSKDIVDVII